MTTELKQAAQEAAEAIDWLLKNIRLDAPQLSGKAMGNAEKCASALRAALAPQPTTAIACGIPGMAKTTCPYCEQGFAFEHEQPATGEPVAWSERELLRHAQAAVVMPMIGPLLDAWENADREVMSQEPELSKQLKNINSAMEDADTHPAPSVRAGVVRVPLQVLKDASEALGNFVSDHGWGDTDMQAMDNLDAYIARHEAIDAAMLAAK